MLANIKTKTVETKAIEYNFCLLIMYFLIFRCIISKKNLKPLYLVAIHQSAF
jgi:hypothetical protein